MTVNFGNCIDPFALSVVIAVLTQTVLDNIASEGRNENASLISINSHNVVAQYFESESTKFNSLSALE